MLDVHPPHNPTHTWRDFFIHIATIVLGLLIAIGLEQLVEYFHHRHQLYEAREAIHIELEVNTRLLDAILSATRDAQTSMQRNIRLLQSPAREHKTPTTALEYPWGIPYPRSNAWQDAKASGAVNYMTTSERAETDYIYGDLDLAEHFAMSWLQQNNITAAIARSAPTIGQLSPQARQQLLEATLQTDGQIVSYRMLITFDQRAIKRYLTFPAQSGLQSAEPRTH
ncbi:MAG: hypothetical protein ABR971_05330 [Acidobacteriaceae bacterium]